MRYADNGVLLQESEEQLQHLVDTVENKSRRKRPRTQQQQK